MREGLRLQLTKSFRPNSNLGRSSPVYIHVKIEYDTRMTPGQQPSTNRERAFVDHDTCPIDRVVAPQLPGYAAVTCPDGAGEEAAVAIARAVVEPDVGGPAFAQRAAEVGEHRVARKQREALSGDTGKLQAMMHLSMGFLK